MSDAFLSASVPAQITPFPLSGAKASLSPLATSGEQTVDSVSKDFEAVFLTQMMGEMFAGDDLTNFFGGGTTGDVYKSYLMNEYGKLMANSGGIGIATQVKQELLKLQEVHA